ncbi:ATP-binding protein [Asticcacaulis sp. 201]|uniref:ATP-binding protein n=1 Tax=Asticcacaulis sp. 201 TaxID=3028787 RepID=UPI002916BE7F|nr:ATP-binding protein [Asticcacaulis sp. 201]MDV6330048.1 ATP-binding protein [Asticcacaulis sp. 201]
MSDGNTDTLVKPDMVAVLSRTHIGHDLHSFLLPTLEAVSNAMHGIEAHFGDDAKTKGRIEIAIANLTDPAKIMVSVTDNGIGLNEENYGSFKTPFSGYKLKTKGRGFGRFIAFKVFARIHYSSRYMAIPVEMSRTFRFDIAQEQELIFHDGDPDFAHIGLRVDYDEPLPIWHDLIKSLDAKDIADHIGSHFLPYFLYKWLPEITLQFDNEPPQSIKSHFEDVFIQAESGTIACEIDGVVESIEYSLTRVPRTRSFKNHCLLFAAADRIVGNPRDLTNTLGQPHFSNEQNEAYIIIAVVRGEVFESRLNDARTGINITPKTVEEIVSAISDVIQKTENSQIAKIKSAQSSELNEALRENPILRIGLKGRTINEYVAGKPNNWKAQDFVSNLAIERYRASKDLSKSIVTAANNPDRYMETIQEIVKKIDESNKEALAEYVVHRKKVIELIEVARKYTGDGKHAPEDTIHDLVFRRFSDTTDTDYFEHNLWLIDDALAFLPYVSSDRSMHGKGRKKGDKIPDLAFFDDSLILGDNDGTTISIVEFKKPSRDDYRFGDDKHDPVMQVINTLKSATAAGGIAKTDGSHFAFTGVVRRFAYIIADIKPSLVAVLRDHDFKNNWNPAIYFRYRDNEQMFIQVMGYDTLIENAKKRNQAFFSVLFGE